MNIMNFTGLETKKGTTVDNSSRSVQFTGRGIEGVGINDCLVTNNSDQTVFVAFGKGSAPTAAETGDGITVVRPGAQIVINKGQADYAAYFALATATGSVYFTAGIGS